MFSGENWSTDYNMSTHSSCLAMLLHCSTADFKKLSPIISKRGNRNETSKNSYEKALLIIVAIRGLVTTRTTTRELREVCNKEKPWQLYSKNFTCVGTLEHALSLIYHAICFPMQTSALLKLYLVLTQS